MFSKTQFGSRLLILALIIVCVLLTVLLLIHSAPASAQGDATNFRGLLERLQNQKTEFFISFTTPVFGDGVLLDITPTVKPSDVSKILDARILEIGDDYLCIGQYGVNVVDESCFPFSNISRINYPSP